MKRKEKFTISNMGNIDNASINIKPLTIIAGENSSGKTFVTKGLYTVLDSLYKKIRAIIRKFN
jgi:predicted ATPase